jgi:TPR repeat protein
LEFAEAAEYYRKAARNGNVDADQVADKLNEKFGA